VKNHISILRAALLALPVVGFAAPAMAHITFEAKEVKADATTKFVLRVPHGCAGSPTTAVRIQIPESLSGVKPQPKPGWTLDIVHADPEVTAATEPAPNPHAGHPAAVVKEVSWSGGKLEDAHYDEFVFRAKVVAAAGAEIFLPIVQQCETGVERWIEIPAKGASSDDLKFPAPSVKVTD